MTNEEIEAAREVLESMINTATGSSYATQSDEQDALARLDALCQAARQAELLEDANRKIGKQLLEHSEALAASQPENPMEGVWRCEDCGELLNVFNGQWRMAGDRWQHSHGQAGHIDAKYFGEASQPESLVGRRVRSKKVRHKHSAVITQVEPAQYWLGRADGSLAFSNRHLRDDFELLEDTDAKGTGTI